MAIEMTKRTKIMAGAGALVLAAAGAGAWFFLFDEPPPAPKAPAAKAPAKPAAPAGAAAKADAPKAEAGKGEAAKGDATKSAAAPAKPKPIPTDPDKLVAEIIEASGLRKQFESFGRDALLRAGSGAEKAAADNPEFRTMTDIVGRVFEPATMTAELSASLKGKFDAERMARFLEVLRQPVVMKLNSIDHPDRDPGALRDFAEGLRKSPLPPARAKLLQTVDEITLASEVGADMVASLARDMADTMVNEMQKAGRPVPREARQEMAAKMNLLRTQARNQMRMTLQYLLRDTSDEDLAEYVRLVDTDTGRWGYQLLAEAIRPMMAARGTVLGQELAKTILAQQNAAAARAKAAKPAATAALPAETKEAAPAAAPASPPPAPEYQRPANIKPLYSRYNDLITATVMRDQKAVKELLDDGKPPNARQSDGATPLMIAAANGDREIAAMLLAKGADPNLRAPGGDTALRIARGRKDAEMAGLLQRAGAKD